MDPKPLMRLVLSACLFFTCCGCGQSRSDQSKWAMRGIMLQAIEQRDVFPSEIKGIPRNPLTGDEPGYEYVQPKPRSEMEPAEFSKQVMIYQLRDGQRDTSLLVVFADGSEGFVD